MAIFELWKASLWLLQMVGKITRIMLKYDIPQVVWFFAIIINIFLNFLRGRGGGLRKISSILFRYLILGRGVCLGNILFNFITYRTNLH